MPYILDLLKEMRRRPLAIYLGEVSLTKLAFFLRGYEHAVMTLDQKAEERFLSAFGDWVRQRFHGQNINQSWENVILFQCINETEAVQLFWKLVDEFVAEWHPDIPDNGSAATSTNGVLTPSLEKPVETP
jgi:hypothetical protein